jgi:hypothetical protein
MDKQTRMNWERVKKALEENGLTDCWYYKRAVALLAGKPDPLP